MEWSTESIEKVTCFVQERPFLFDVPNLSLFEPNLHELAQKFDARNLRKKLVHVFCASFLTVCHHHNTSQCSLQL